MFSRAEMYAERKVFWTTSDYAACGQQGRADGRRGYRTTGDDRSARRPGSSSLATRNTGPIGPAHLGRATVRDG